MTTEGFSNDGPYPGLRPFQPDDQIYFFGRSRATFDVVERLRSRHFVAVIGGSGSGKSSLVLAGAVPALRARASAPDGDFWVPVVMRPGTNLPADQHPLRRLAVRFADLLCDGPGKLADVEDELIHGAGLRGLVRRFGRELAQADGLDLTSSDKQVNFLFLVDQFEEIFHESNFQDPEMRASCERFVEVLVEQFNRGTPGVHVALTMRSEFLNDCPMFPGLAKAVNEASYLVDRMSEGELREVIEEPVRRWLERCHFRQQAARVAALRRQVPPPMQAPLPESIDFDPDLTDALLRDSRALLRQRDHSDHLPLLQHMLYWIWRAAAGHIDSHSEGAVPGRITLQHAEQAARAPGANTTAAMANDGKSLLEQCLCHRCDEIYQAGGADLQQVWTRMFRRLAYKEPGTGYYTQERLALTAAEQIASPMPVRDLLAPWLTPHVYLHEDPPNLKVAHETLIRRWPRFTHWVDEDDRSFAQYLRVLERCAAFSRDGQRLGEAEIADVAGTNLELRLADADEAARLHAMLERHRNGPALKGFRTQALSFIVDSRKKLEKERRHRKAIRWLWLAVPALITVMSVLAWQLGFERVLGTAERHFHLSYASASETVARLPTRQSAWMDGQLPLRNALQAHQAFVAGEEEVQRRWVRWPDRWLRWVPGIGARLDTIGRARQLAEFRLTDAFRQVLTRSVFVREDAVDGSQAMQVLPDLGCELNLAPASGSSPVPTSPPSPPASGIVSVDFYPQVGLVDDGQARSGLALRRGDGVRTLYPATLDNSGCRLGNALLPLAQPQARLGVSADLSTVVIESEEGWNLASVLWRLAPDPLLQQRLQVARWPMQLKDGQLQPRMAAMPLPEIIPAWRQEGENWTSMRIDDQTLRLLALEQMLAAPPADAVEFRVLPAGSASVASATMADRGANSAAAACGLLRERLKPDQGTDFYSAVVGQRPLCLQLSHVDMPNGGREVQAKLYDASLGADAAATPLLPTRAVGQSVGAVRVGSDRLYFKRISTPGSADEWLAVPWSLKAWTSLANEVFSARQVDRPAVKDCLDPACLAGQDMRQAQQLIFVDQKESLVTPELHGPASASQPR